MLSGISHDLRTPLTRMKLQIAFIKEKELANKLSEDINEMEKMLNEYLQFTSSAYLEKDEMFDLSELIQEIIKKYNNDNISFKIPYRIHINGRKMNDYFKKMNLQIAILRPLSIVNREKEYDVRCSVKGGGLSGQAGAIIHGVARAITEYEPELKSILKKEKLTTRDSRSVERKKYGHRKARRSFQFSKR